MNKISLILFIGIIKIICIHCHGRLLNPIARSSMWREDKSLHPFFDDHLMYCGGSKVQWKKNNGKCGICGEDWSKPKKFEKGGIFYRGVIVKTYTENQVINVTLEMTANHLGYFQFGICNVDNLSTDATQECFDKNLLEDLNGNKRIPIKGTDLGMKSYMLRLPKGLLCSHCVFQWKYNAGNALGVDPVTKESCIGCGPQVQFYGCSDVAITSASVARYG